MAARVDNRVFPDPTEEEAGETEARDGLGSRGTEDGCLLALFARRDSSEDELSEEMFPGRD